MPPENSQPQSQPESNASADLNNRQLNKSEKVFLAFSIIGAFFFLLGILLFHFVIIPGAEDPSILYFLVSWFWVAFAALTITSTINIRRKSLLLIPTIIQCFVLCFTVYLIPIAIMGILLLRKRAKADTMKGEN